MAGKMVLVVSREFIQGTSIPLHLGLFLRLLGLPHSMVAGFQETRSGIYRSLKAWACKLAKCHFCCIVSVKQSEPTQIQT